MKSAAVVVRPPAGFFFLGFIFFLPCQFFLGTLRVTKRSVMGVRYAMPPSKGGALWGALWGTAAVCNLHQGRRYAPRYTTLMCA